MQHPPAANLSAVNFSAVFEEGDANARCNTVADAAELFGMRFKFWLDKLNLARSEGREVSELYNQSYEPDSYKNLNPYEFIKKYPKDELLKDFKPIFLLLLSK